MGQRRQGAYRARGARLAGFVDVHAATANAAAAPDDRVSVVVLTHNRPQELRRVVERLRELPERPRIVVVDNASAAGVVARVLTGIANVELVTCAVNLGAAGRNAGVARVRTPYVAFCDDDTWWEPGALRRAADRLQAFPEIGVLNARVLVGVANVEDPTSVRMGRSPLDAAGLPGPTLASFMAGACVMRTTDFLACGGYEPRLFLGAEELLLSLDLAVRGRRIVYAADVVTHHHPSSAVRDPTGRRIATARNRLWIACMRLPWRCAWRFVFRTLREAARDGVLWRAVAQALRGLPWALRRRRPVPLHVAGQLERAFETRSASAARTPSRDVIA